MADDDNDQRRARAYRLWDEAGRPEGRDQEFWFLAENDDEPPKSSPRPQNGESRPIGPGPSGMEQTDDQDNLNNNVSNVD